MAPPLVAVCGSVAADLIGYGPRLPGPGETVRGDDFLVAPGGKGANQAVAAARMGVRVRLFGAIGDDPYGVLCRAALLDDGVELDDVRIDPGASTGVALIAVDAKGENQILALPGANLRADPPLACAAHVWICQGEVPTASIAGTLAAAHSDGAVSICNASPAGAIHPALVARFDIAVVNEHERTALGATLPARCVITRGRDGAVLLPDGIEVPAPAVAVLDATGAGDALAGVLAAGLAEGRPVAEALQRAVVAASLSVESRGCQPSYPTRRDVEDRLR